jgi:hypothetical protein
MLEKDIGLRPPYGLTLPVEMAARGTHREGYSPLH